MRDKTLVALVILIAILNVGHTIDHVVRGDVQWPLTIDSLGFIVVSAIIYALIGLGLYLYWNGKVGRRSLVNLPALLAFRLQLNHFSHSAAFSSFLPQHIITFNSVN